MAITELSLVEIKYLMAPKKLHLPTALKAIFRELLLKKVLDNYKDFRFPNERSKKTQKYDMFIPGPNFEEKDNIHYAKQLTLPFTEMGKVQTKVLTNFALSKYSLPSKFIASEIKVPLKKEGYIKEVPILKSFGMWGATSKAKEELIEINTFVEEQADKIRESINDDLTKFIEIIEETGHLVFLIEKTDADLWKEIVAMFKKTTRNQPLGPARDLSEYLKASKVDLHFFEH